MLKCEQSRKRKNLLTRIFSRRTPKFNSRKKFRLAKNFRSHTFLMNSLVSIRFRVTPEGSKFSKVAFIREIRTTSAHVIVQASNAIQMYTEYDEKTNKKHGIQVVWSPKNPSCPVSYREWHQGHLELIRNSIHNSKNSRVCCFAGMPRMESHPEPTSPRSKI